MQGATLLCVVAITLVLWAVLRQPGLGVTLAADAAANRVTIAAVDTLGPARGLAVPATLAAIGATPAPSDAMTLEAGDLIEEPDMLESYRGIDRFMARQSKLAALLQAPRVTLHLATPGGPAIRTVTPATRDLRNLPLAFWVQLVTGAGTLLIGAWVLAMRPAELVTRLFALSGAMVTLAAYTAAIYSSRELALDGGFIRILSALNHVGTLGFGIAMIAMFLRYPRALAPTSTLWIVPAIFVPWLVADITRLAPNQLVGTQLPASIEMLLIIVLIGLQWMVNRRDPRARAALNWLGLSVIIGAGAFVALVITPALFESAPLTSQGHAFGFFLLIYGGIALGVARYRLFDLSEWTFRVLFYTAGMLLLLAIDAGLIAILHLQHETSLGIALLAVGFVYLPLRSRLWRRFAARNRLKDHELFRAVTDVSFAASAHERAERWRELLNRLFDPLAIEPADHAVDKVAIGREGLELQLPPAADTPAVVLRYAAQGRSLFSRSDQQLAEELVRMTRTIEEGRSAYERGSVEERRRIARDLHDDVGARLLSGLYKTDLDDTHRVLREAIADIRTIVSGLATDQPPLGRTIAALRHETGERLAAAGIELHWPLARDDDSTTALGYQTYRGFTAAHREIVSNVIRHARADNVTVTAGQHGETLCMTVTDDGIGIDATHALGSSRGNGLRGLERRLAQLGGTLTIVRQAPGTSVAIDIPMHVAPAADAGFSVTAAAGHAMTDGTPHSRGAGP